MIVYRESSLSILDHIKYIVKYINTYIYIHTHIHTYIYIHTYIHVHTHSSLVHNTTLDPASHCVVNVALPSCAFVNKCGL